VIDAPIRSDVVALQPAALEECLAGERAMAMLEVFRGIRPVQDEIDPAAPPEHSS
jgi:hypothetical protein